MSTTGTYWDVLGIEATIDVASIKRAYAKKLKATRPDDDAQAYQLLREAYDWAQGFAQWFQAHPDEWAEYQKENQQEHPQELPAESNPAQHTLPIQVVELATPITPQTEQLTEKNGVLVAEYIESAPSNSETIATTTEAPREDAAFNTAEIKATTDLPSPTTPAELIHSVHAYIQHHGYIALPLFWEELRTLMDEMPFQWRDEMNGRFVELVLTNPHLPDEFVLALASYFDWGNDYRLERIVGIGAVLQLTDYLNQQVVSPKHAQQAQQEFPLTHQYNQLSQEKRGFAAWLLLLLNPLHFHDELNNLAGPKLRQRLGITEQMLGRIKFDKNLYLVIYYLLFLSGLSFIQADHSLVPENFIGSVLLLGLAGFFGLLLTHYPVIFLHGAYEGFSEGGIWKWHEKYRHHTYLLAPICLYLLFVFGCAILLRMYPNDWVSYRQVSLMQVFVCPALIFLVWPYGLPWEKLMVPLGLAIGYVVATQHGMVIGAANALPFTFLWLLCNHWTLVHFRPSSFLSLPWLAKKNNNKNILTTLLYPLFLLASFLFFAPLFFMLHAAQKGFFNAYLVLLAAVSLYASNLLPTSLFTLVFWLWIALLGSNACNKFSEKISQSRFLAPKE